MYRSKNCRQVIALCRSHRDIPCDSSFARTLHLSSEDGRTRGYLLPLIANCQLLFAFYFLSFTRITNFNPDHVSSIAQTFTSTSPHSNPTRRTTSSVRSVGRPLAFLGQPIQSIPSGTSAAERRPKSLFNSANWSVKYTLTLALPESLSAACPPSGSLPRSLTKMAGWLRRMSRYRA
jgi:hypothetical protein